LRHVFSSLIRLACGLWLNRSRSAFYSNSVFVPLHDEPSVSPVKVLTIYSIHTSSDGYKRSYCIYIVISDQRSRRTTSFGATRRKRKEASLINPQDDLMATSNSLTPSPPQRKQPVELGTIHYVNLTADGRHGDMEKALVVAAESGKPIFANFVEWTG
jgi:hypothetical protein